MEKENIEKKNPISLLLEEKGITIDIKNGEAFISKHTNQTNQDLINTIKKTMFEERIFPESINKHKKTEILRYLAKKWTPKNVPEECTYYTNNPEDKYSIDIHELYKVIYLEIKKLQDKYKQKTNKIMAPENYLKKLIKKAKTYSQEIKSKNNINDKKVALNSFAEFRKKNDRIGITNNSFKNSIFHIGEEYSKQIKSAENLNEKKITLNSFAEFREKYKNWRGVTNDSFKKLISLIAELYKAEIAKTNKCKNTYYILMEFRKKYNKTLSS